MYVAERERVVLGPEMEKEGRENWEGRDGAQVDCLKPGLGHGVDNKEQAVNVLNAADEVRICDGIWAVIF